MTAFLLALQFLTAIPVRIREFHEKKHAASMIFFPLAGLLLGLVLVGINQLLLFLHFNQLAASIITIVSLVILTSGLHLDGLADTADALLSRERKDEMLEIMRDAHIGVMGVLGIACALLLKISLLYSVWPELKTGTLILMCALSRWAMVFAIFIFPYARQEGKAKVFFDGINNNIFILSTLITLALCAAIWKAGGLLVFGSSAIIAYLAGNLVYRKINGITGDSLGAINEIVEIAVLFAVCLLEKMGIWII
jgi:adenosylcobinamide-GDP ribazoletransferase